MSDEKRIGPADNGAESKTSDAIISVQRIGSTVERQLELTLWNLLSGELELHDLTPALQAWWVAAYESGRKSLDESAETQSLRFQRDMWMFVASNRGKKPGDYYGHLSSRLWEQADVSGDYSSWREEVAA